MDLAARSPVSTPAAIDPQTPRREQANPLSAHHLQAISDARHRSRRIRRAASVATLSGWSMLCFAGLSLAIAPFGHWSGWVVGGALGCIALNELRGSAMLRRADPAGSKVLGWNQVVLAALLVASALWSLASTLRQPPSAALQSGDPQIDAMAAGITSAVTYGLYGSMAVLGLLLPGLTAIYYFTRARIIRAFLAETPDWIVEIMRRS